MLPASVPAQAGADPDVTTAPGEDAGLELLGRAGMVAVQVADLAWPAGRGPGKDGRSALTAAGAGTIRGERYLARVDGLAGALALAGRHGGQVPDQGGHHLGVVRAAPPVSSHSHPPQNPPAVEPAATRSDIPATTMHSLSVVALVGQRRPAPPRLQRPTTSNYMALRPEVTHLIYGA